jgi:hypothetical protein
MGEKIFRNSKMCRMTWGKMQRKENGRRKNLSESRTGRGETFPRTEPKAGFLFSRLGD